jgi:hypothetical protein
LTKRDRRATTEEKPAAQIPDRVRTDRPNLSERERQEILRLAERRRNRRRAPKVQVRSKPGKPLVVNFPSPVELERFLAAVGTSEPAHAGLMLCGILEAACDGLREEDVNRVLAAVTGIGANGPPCPERNYLPWLLRSISAIDSILSHRNHRS